jgi:hypothetical protein
VCHFDNNPANNRVENLYWGTNAMNAKQCTADGRRPYGEHMKIAKLNNQKAKLVRLMYNDFKWTQSKIWRILGKAWGIKSTTTIWDIIHNKIWTH